MIRPFGLSLLTLPAAAILTAGLAQAQTYYPAPQPYYRSAPPPAAYYRDRVPAPGYWVEDDEDDQPVMTRPRRMPRMTQQVPQQGQYGEPSRILPYESDAAAPPPPGFARPDGRPADYGHQFGAQPLGPTPGAPPPAANSEPDAIRPPGSIGATPNAAPQPATPSTVMTLPPEDQPEQGQPKELPAHLKKQLVDYATKEPAGTIVVDTSNTYLYLVLGGGKALRYGIGVGREGFTWAGTERVSKMKEWPDWFPPTEMIERQPYLPRVMAGGPGNPLGARALYLGKTLYRIHGTNQPSTIGQTVSSGCIRLLNEDIEDLYSRVQVGSRVVVLPGKPPETVANNANPATAGGPIAAGMPTSIAPASQTAISGSPLPPAR